MKIFKPTVVLLLEFLKPTIHYVGFHVSVVKFISFIHNTFIHLITIIMVTAYFARNFCVEHSIAPENIFLTSTYNI